MCDVRDPTGTSEASWVLAHSGMGYGFDLALSKVFTTSKAKAEWLDPRTGKRQAIGPVDVTDRVAFSPPSSGSVEHDWVLIVTRVP